MPDYEHPYLLDGEPVTVERLVSRAKGMMSLSEAIAILTEHNHTLEKNSGKATKEKA